MGSIDKVEKVYSVSLRQVDVGSGEVVRNVTTDCFDCSLEDVFVKSIRRTALLLAGVSKEEVDKIVPSAHARSAAGNVIARYKGEKSDINGDIAIKVLPDQCEIYLDKENYGSGTKTISDVPVGKHTVKAFRADLGRTMKKKVDVYKGTQSDVEITLDKERFIRISLGYSLEFVAVDDYVDVEWLSTPRAYNTLKVDHIGNSNIILNLGIKTVRHYFGLRAYYGMNEFYSNLYGDDHERSDPANNGEYKTEAMAFDGTSFYPVGVSYDINNYSGGFFLEYAYSFRFFKYLLTVEPGISFGAGLLGMEIYAPEINHEEEYYTPDPYYSSEDHIRARIVDSNLEEKWNNYVYVRDLVELGGPNLAVTYGNGKSRLSGRYDLKFATDFENGGFFLVHEFQLAATWDL